MIAAYSGTAPGDSKIGYSLLVMGHTGTQVVQFILSEIITPEENLYLILVTTILAVPLFTIADIHYGSGTSRNICGKKKPVVVENEHTELVFSSSKEKGMTLRVLLHLCVLCQPLLSLSCTFKDHFPLKTCLITRVYLYTLKIDIGYTLCIYVIVVSHMHAWSHTVYIYYNNNQ